MSFEQYSIYDLSPNWSSTDRGAFFTCGRCRLRRHESMYGSSRGRGGSKWIECAECLRRSRGQSVAAWKRRARRAREVKRKGWEDLL